MYSDHAFPIQSMRKFIAITIGLVVIACIGTAISAACIRHYNTVQTSRVKDLAAALQQLSAGVSDFKAARAIASEFGTVPYDNHYGTRDCADGYFERCAYMIRMNNAPMRRLLLQHPILRHIGVKDWQATAFMYIKEGTVQEYRLTVIYKTSNGLWRGVSAEEQTSLPENRAVQARMSDSYSIQRNDVASGGSEDGFELEASLTPTADATERKRAWNMNLACLKQRQGCGEICEVTPDVWHDFYAKRGHYDVEKYGPAYLFCTKAPD